ncbi:MAG: hypothetical protein Q4B43_07585 [Bacteroidota bacterium]|nr:hypothetical protein [Bacteroidota bacterium]
MLVKEITAEEWQLIDTLRNYRSAYPNGTKMYKTDIQELLDVLMDIEYQEEENEEN